MIAFRQIVAHDIPAVVEIVESQGSDPTAIPGITEDAILARLRNNHAGWIALMHGRPAGFAMASRGTGEVWVIAVRPECQRQSIGRELMRQAEAWLFSHGWREIWFSVDDDERRRAVGFFRHLGWVDWTSENASRLKKGNSRVVITLEEHAVSDPVTGYTRLVRLQRGPDREPHRLCLFLDGEHYWRDMDAVPVLNDLCSRGIVPDMTFAFVGHVSGAARHEDYTCNERYADYIGNGVVEWLRGEIPSLQEEGHIIAGLSLSGLMAAYVTLRFPQRFTYCLSQSGSHWWRPEWFATMARQHAPIDARFWLSVGDQETAVHVTHPPTGLFQEVSQIAGVEKAVHVIGEAGGTVYYNRSQGTHSVHGWREELSQALSWLLTGGASSAGPEGAAAVLGEGQ